MLNEHDRYTIRVIWRDYRNNFGTPPCDVITLLLDYLAKRAALRAKYRLVAPDYVNTNDHIEGLVAKLA